VLFIVVGYCAAMHNPSPAGVKRNFWLHTTYVCTE